VNGLFAVLLTSIGFECETFDVGVTLTNASINQARDVVSVLEKCPPVAELAQFVTNLTVEKYDELIPEALRRDFWARCNEHLSAEVSSLLHELQ
jgi:ATP-dependent Lhr-like helicase